ncbi:MAG TPA: septum formation protein Maf, partial [Thermopetrobacter sp.]|nr:septum formation protein Maf [Thermopetrobacter sp.]
AAALAREKALEVSRRTSLPVLGADQILVCDGEIFSKPADMDQARETLRRLRGRAHRLISALCVAENGEVLWTCERHADLVMRDFSDAFLEWYLRTVGEAALASVGCYQVEGPGIQLFERIEGDWFTIIGLPLLPFLDWLRRRGILPA